jgi:hypothetical protein
MGHQGGVGEVYKTHTKSDLDVLHMHRKRTI